jgi:hypothetical protein
MSIQASALQPADFLGGYRAVPAAGRDGAAAVTELPGHLDPERILVDHPVSNYQGTELTAHNAVEKIRDMPPDAWFVSR